MRKSLLMFFLILLLIPTIVLAEETGLSFAVVPETVHPGRIERVSFTSSVAGTGRLTLQKASGEVRCVIREGFAVSEGVNNLTWDGLDETGAAVEKGSYVLCLTVNGASAEQVLTVGEPSPQILALSAPSVLEIGSPWQFTVRVNEAGTLNLRVRTGEGDGQQWQNACFWNVQAGDNTCAWDGTLDGAALAPGQITAQIYLSDPEGFSSTAQQLSISIVTVTTATPQPTATPVPVMIPSQAVKIGEEKTSYWTLPIGEFDEAAIWEVMMQPMTVIVESGKTQKDVYRLRLTPDSAIKNNVVGEITYESQGVHILETLDNGWTLVEAYNSSYGPNCTSRPGYGVTDDLIQGYVKTSLLKTITPRTEYGLLIDKCEQIMYIFSDGKCIGSLLVSTGLNNAKQSWNETPSGEFVMISKIGGFAAGNLWCAYGMRVNGGCAIHEVPYIGNADTPAANRDYSSTVKLLGQKASHGCIRVQKASNEQGQNIKWLWDNIKVNTKVLIWDDTDRLRPYPAADDYELYYNPDGGSYYHENQNCPSVKSRYLPLTPFTYGELDSGSFAKLQPCPKCTTMMRKSQIDAMNAEAASK